MRLRGAVDGDARRIGIHPLFVARGRVALLAQRAGSAADVGALELGALEEKLARRFGDAAVQSAHDARQRDRLFAVGDDEVLARELERLFVERGDLLPFPRAADADAAVRDAGEVERVHGLTQLEQDEVGDVDHVVDGAQPAQREAAAHPERRAADLDVAHIMPDVPGAEVGRLHGDVHPLTRAKAPHVVGQRDGLHGLVQHRGDLARDAVDALAVGRLEVTAMSKM